MSRTLTKRLEYVEQYEVIVGIDLGKRRNVAAVRDRKGQIIGRHDFGHSQTAYAKLVSWSAQSGTAVLFGFEGTNDYWRWLANYLHDVDARLYQLNVIPAAEFFYAGKRKTV